MTIEINPFQNEPPHEPSMIMVRLKNEEEKNAVVNRCLEEKKCVIISVVGALVVGDKVLAMGMLHRLAMGVAAAIDNELIPVMTAKDDAGRDCIGIALDGPHQVALYGVTEEEFLAEMAKHPHLGDAEPPDTLQ